MEAVQLPLSLLFVGPFQLMAFEQLMKISGGKSI
jgi:hypothetical protein